MFGVDVAGRDESKALVNNVSERFDGAAVEYVLKKPIDPALYEEAGRTLMSDED